MDPPPPPPLHADNRRRRRCREYLLALEEEERKIRVFQRELPLCLDLVTQSECPRARSPHSPSPLRRRPFRPINLCTVSAMQLSRR